MQNGQVRIESLASTQLFRCGRPKAIACTISGGFESWRDQRFLLTMYAL